MTQDKVAQVLLRSLSDMKEYIRNQVRGKETIALVGSSSILNKSRLGSQIESHDYVVRFNYAETSKFMVDVGEKTSLRFLGATITPETLMTRSLDFTKEGSTYITKYKNIPYLQSLKFSQTGAVIMFDFHEAVSGGIFEFIRSNERAPVFIKELVPRGVRPVRSGLALLTFFAHSLKGEKLRVFGFDRCPPSNPDGYHRYSDTVSHADLGGRLLQNHIDLRVEYWFLNYLYETGKVEFID